MKISRRDEGRRRELKRIDRDGGDALNFGVIHSDDARGQILGSEGANRARCSLYI